MIPLHLEYTGQVRKRRVHACLGVLFISEWSEIVPASLWFFPVETCNQG